MHEIWCSPDDFSEVRDALTEQFGDPREANLTWKPQNLVPMEEEDQARVLLKLLDALDESDDVQRVAANFDIPDEVMEKLTL